MSSENTPPPPQTPMSKLTNRSFGIMYNNAFYQGTLTSNDRGIDIHCFYDGQEYDSVSKLPFSNEQLRKQFVDTVNALINNPKTNR